MLQSLLPSSTGYASAPGFMPTTDPDRPHPGRRGSTLRHFSHPASRMASGTSGCRCFCSRSQVVSERHSRQGIKPGKDEQKVKGRLEIAKKHNLSRSIDAHRRITPFVVLAGLTRRSKQTPVLAGCPGRARAERRGEDACLCPSLIRLPIGRGTSAMLDILILIASITTIMLRMSITQEGPDVRNRTARTHCPAL
jgi:hypothetical protein